MSWQDAPEVEAPAPTARRTPAAQPAWMSAPAIDDMRELPDESPAGVDPATLPESPTLKAAMQRGFASALPFPLAAPATAVSMLAKRLGLAEDDQVTPLEPLAETAATLGSSAVAAPVAGIAGLATGTANTLGRVFAGRPLFDATGADVVEDVQGALTFEPGTQGGQTLTGAVSYPFEKLAEGADFLGDLVARGTSSPALGATANTALQTLPALFLRGRGGKVASAEKPAPAPPGAPAAAAISPEQAAQAYVARTAGVDWNALPAQIRSTLTDIAKDAGALESLPAEAVTRQLQLQSLPVPVPATAGRLSRDPVQLRNESNVAATNAGKPIRDIELEANEALLANLDVLRGRVAGQGKTASKAQTPEQVGLSVQDEALRSKLALKKQEVSDLYKKAETAGELEAPVSPKSIMDVIESSPDKTHFGWVQSWLKDMGVTKTEKTGGIKVETTRTVSLKELEDLRQAAVARAMDGGTEGFYAGKVIRAIDDATEGAGGTAYQAARKARREQALEFEEQGAVARLVENKSRTDRSTALEDTWRKTVLGGSIDDLRNVKRSLLTGGDQTTRTAGKKAWRDIRAQTIDHIRNEATKSVATNERGQPNITPASMKRAIDSIGPEKLNEIFGPGTADRIGQIMEATRTVKTVPPPLHGGSSTMGNILAFLERGLNKVPVIGDVGAGAIRAGAQLKEIGAGGRITRAAQESPIDRAAKYARRGRAGQQVRSAVAPYTTATQGHDAITLADELVGR